MFARPATSRVLTPVQPRPRRWLRILAGILIVLLVLTLAAAAGGYLYLRRGLPQTDGEVQVAGLTEPTTVYRDAWGVIHVYARNGHDLYFAQGYATAQDRLWQMDLSRRAAAGRLAEIFGADLVDTDKFLRTFGLRRDAERSVQAASPEAMAALEAYAAGVNAYIDQATATGQLPPEFRLLGYTPEPWQPADTAGIAKFMAYDLGGNWDDEVWNFQMAQHVGLDRLADLLPRYPADGPLIMKYAAGVEVESLMRTALVPSEWLGSNNWVLAGSRTATGKPLLANDPHLGLGTPSIWYQTHLVVPGRMNVIGVTFPGAPGVIIGHNEHVAWGVTNLGPDVQDLYLEIPNPENPREFLYQGHWEPARVLVEEIRVKGREEPVRHEILITRHGPIITPVAGSKQNRPAAALALRWTAQEPTEDLWAFLSINQARNWQEFRAGLRYFAAPAQNFVFAATDGTIAYRGNGLIPIRAKGNGEFPVPGWTGEHEWTGFIPWEELPEAVNPPEGFIATANAKVVDDAYPYLLTNNWAPPYRTARIREVLQQADGWTVDEMKAVQTDFADLQARSLVPRLLPYLAQGLTALGGATGREQDAMAELDAWDKVDSVDSAGAAIWRVWYRHLQEALYADEMGEDLFRRMPNATLVTDRLLAEAAGGRPSTWFDNINTPEREGLPEVLASSFRAALAELSEQLGGRVSGWRWGRLHQVPFPHQLGAVAALRPIFSVRARPMGGSDVTVGAASYSRLGPEYLVTHAAPWRQVVDLNDPAGNSWDVTAPGQSGHPLSRHYRDQASLWVEGGYHRQLFREEDLATADKLILVPAGI